ncbi:MAG: DUF5979 domain-containing protein [Acidimicrobiales bacterium]
MSKISGTRGPRTAGAVLIVLGVLAAIVGVTTPAAGLEPGVPEVTLEDGVNGCNGVLPTPGSENTTKRLDPDFPSNFDPGGVVGFLIDYPVDPDDVAGRETFVITDCVFVDDDAVAKYSVSFVPNTADFQLRFAVPVAPDTPLGAQFCNYAKTTAAPSESQASNRKAGPACFTVGGALRIEKRSGSATGPLLPGASFSVVCSPTVTQPATIITGLSSPSQTNQDGTVSASGTTAGSIAIAGPSGTPCTVTETAAPPGYQVDPTPRQLVIPIGTSQTINVFVNRQLGNLVISKTTTGGTGTFTFHVDCDGTEFDQDTTITGSGTATVTGIPAGTSCTVTEETHALFTSFSVPSNGTVTIAAGDNTVSFTNTRRTANLVVEKTTTGGSGTFQFSVDCDGTDFDQTFSITDNGSRTVTGIPTGTSCTVTEQADPLFTSSSTPANGTVTIDDEGATVSFTNRRNVGDLVITKTAVGGTGTFTFGVDCDGTAFDQAVTIEGTGSHTIAGIPTGTSCVVTERDNPLFSPVVVPNNGTVTIAAGDNTVAFTNTRNTGSLVIEKTTTGGTGTFTFDVDCDGSAFDQSVTITGTGSTTISGIPTTDSCEVTERPDPLFTSSATPANGTVTIGASLVTVAFTNTAKPTGISLDKKVNGADHPTAGDALVVHAGDELTYTVVITNTGQVPVSIVSLADSLEPGFATSCPQGVGSTLAAGASFTCTYKATAGGNATNVAGVVALDGLDRRSSASDQTHVRVIHPAITISKTADPPSVSENGTVTFSYTVTNTGDTPLRDVTVTDDVLGGIAVIGDLAPGATTTVTKSQTVTAASPTRNIGTATGVDMLGAKVSASDPADISIVLGLLLELPRTGSSVGLLTASGAALVLGGMTLLVVGRRRRTV